MARVLIVDDEPRIRDLIREHLQYAGFTCAEAGDGTQALAELANGGIDLVILDIMMPFMDGMTCLREMRTRKIMTPVIMLTARSEEYDKLAGLEGGADDYVVKPFSPRQLVARVEAVLRRSALEPLPLAVHAAQCPYRQAMIESLKHDGRRARVVLESPSNQAVKACVEAGLAISLIDRARKFAL